MAGPRDDHSYRRGLVFGWSLAEVFLLIVFALLFAFAAKVGQSQPHNPSKQPHNLNQPPSPARPGPTAYPTDDFNSLARKLRLCEKRKKACDKVNQDLTQQIASLKAQSEKLKKQIEKLKKENGQVEQQLQALTQPGHNGVDYRPCFQDVTGKAEYIFDVTLTDAGIIVHKNDLPDKRDIEAALPLDQMTFDHELSDSDFTTQSQGVFSYSVKHDCRFVVTVRDQTGPDKKDTYKERLRTVTALFYQHQVKTAEPAPRAASDD